MPATLDRTQAITKGERPPSTLFRIVRAAPSGTWGSLAIGLLQPLPEERVAWVVSLAPGGAGLATLFQVHAMAAVSHTYGLRSAALGVSADEEWHLRNRRRLQLIERKYAGGITTLEQQELDGLNASLDTYLDALSPMPFETLESIRDAARREGIDIPAA